MKKYALCAVLLSSVMLVPSICFGQVVGTANLESSSCYHSGTLATLSASWLYDEWSGPYHFLCTLNSTLNEDPANCVNPQELIVELPHGCWDFGRPEPQVQVKFTPAPCDNSAITSYAFFFTPTQCP
jgi:hypothetical protein